jgi:choice-of-anchor B domain-containing protein
MMLRFVFTALTLLVSGHLLLAQPNWNMTKLANVQYAEGCNDIWGYVDSTGVEYAILGTRQATAILSLADPSNPQEIAYIPGSNSTWRDMKTWEHFAYVTCDDGNDGLLIIDLSTLPDSVTWRYWRPELTVNGFTATLRRCHNLYIDENGYAYLSGCGGLNNGGVIIFDVHSNPGFPELVGHVEPVYSHDNFTRGDTVYSANLTEGFFVTDVSDKEEHVTLATQKTSLNFTHNVWPSDDGNYVFTTDERSNAFMDAYDISDLQNITLTDRFQPSDTRGTGVIPHNTHYYQGYNVVSWYTDGVIVIDSHKPDNLVQVANYDTYLGNQVGFQGCWGAYPFLPSGRLLASDINTCLWVFDIDYLRASYLEGTVIDAITKAPIPGASIVILAGQPNERISGPNGGFRTGSNLEGALSVRVEKSGYFPKTTSFDLTQGEVTEVVIELTPLQTTTLSGLVRDAETGLPIEGAGVWYRSLLDQSMLFEASTDVDGLYSYNEIFLGDYEVIAGAWGYQYTPLQVNLSGPGNAIIDLEKGYRDDFVFDYGWTVSGNALRGHWERGVPEPTTLGNQPLNPYPALAIAYGESCYATGLEAGSSAGEFDLDDGTTILTSPLMVLEDYENPVIRYHYWFANTGGNSTPNDSMKVWLEVNGEETLVRTYTVSTFNWVEDSLFLRDYAGEWAEVRIRFVASDLPGSGHIVECGLDHFMVLDQKVVSTQPPVTGAPDFQILPNPFREGFRVTIPAGLGNNPVLFQVFDESGRAIVSGQLQPGQWIGQSWPTGRYFLHLQQGTERSVFPLVKVGH